MNAWRAFGARPRVALVAPASAVPEEMVEEAVRRLEALALDVRPGRHLGARDGPWAGSVAQRAADLTWALTDPEIDIVWLARGGEGTAAAAARVPWQRARCGPRPVLGMSDATFLHGALSRRGWPSVHAAMPAVRVGWDAFAAGAAISALRAGPGWTLPWPEGWPKARALRPGQAVGPVVGGNLTCLGAALGTPLRPRTRGSILLLEDVGEAAYRLDRVLTQLSQSGILRSVAGVLLGTFTDCPPSGGLAVEAVLERHVGGLGVPVLAGLPLGHGPVQSALPLGVPCRLDADKGSLTLLEAPAGAARAG